jgi:hypothetical protein
VAVSVPGVVAVAIAAAEIMISAAAVVAAEEA